MSDKNQFNQTTFQHNIEIDENTDFLIKNLNHNKTQNLFSNNQHNLNQYPEDYYDKKNQERRKMNLTSVEQYPSGGKKSF